MYIVKNIGKAGVVSRDVLQAIDELVEEGKLEIKKTNSTILKSGPFGEPQVIPTQIQEVIVSVEVQANIQSTFRELNLPMNLLERNGYWVTMNLLKSKSTEMQERLSLDSFLRRLVRERDIEHHSFHKYATFWDVGKKLQVGIDKLVVGEILDVPYPRFERFPQDPIKRNVELVMRVLRGKKELGAEHFWVSSIKSSFNKNKEKTLGTVCVISGFLCTPLEFDSASKTYMSTVSESPYLVHPHLQIPIFLDADVESTAFYFTTLDDLFSYEYIIVGVISEHLGEPVIKCYGLIAIDDVPSPIKDLWITQMRNV